MLLACSRRNTPQPDRFVMRDRDHRHDFARGLAVGTRAIARFRSDDFEMSLVERLVVAIAQDLVRTLEQGFGLTLRFLRGIDADDGLQCRCLPAFRIGRADLVAVGRSIALHAGHQHPVRTVRRHHHFAEIADRVGHDVGLRIADLVDHLLGHRPDRDESARSFRFGQDEAAVGAAFGDRIADVRRVGHEFPVGESAAGDLCRALGQVADQRSGCKQVEIVGCPAEFMNQRSERQRGIDHASGQHDVRAFGQQRGDGEAAEIGVHRRELDIVGQGIAAEHFLQALGLEFRDAPAHVVAGNDADLRRESLFGQNLAHCLGGAVRIEPAPVGHHLATLGQHFAKEGGEIAQERGDVAIRVGLGVARQRSESQFGKAVIDDIVAACVDQCLVSVKTVEPEGRAAADLHDLAAVCHISCPLPFARSAAVTQQGVRLAGFQFS
ncbi:MAG: hypothetical protein KDE32_07000 [Novosphingobium sp.]|nr:hypothetical protein [Novosphingobium sp.]